MFDTYGGKFYGMIYLYISLEMLARLTSNSTKNLRLPKLSMELRGHV